MNPGSISEVMQIEEVKDQQLVKQLERKKNRNNGESWTIWQYWQWITRSLAPVNSRVFLLGELYKPEKAEELVDLLGRWSTENMAHKHGDLFDKYGGHEEYLQRMIAEDTRLHRQLWRRYVQAHVNLAFDGIRRIFF
jgi:hypothetical protein